MKRTLFCLVLILTFFVSFAAAQNITSVAGDGPNTQLATAVGIANPTGLAVDASGNIYVAIPQLHIVDRITPGGLISRFAGTGATGTGEGDGGPAFYAPLNTPTALAIDPAGNLYISDIDRNTIRRVAATNGTITTVAGNGVPGFSGDGVATSVSLNAPVGITVDGASNLYIADRDNQRIRWVSLGSGTIATIAGTGVAGYTNDTSPITAGTAQFNNPVAVAVDAGGSVYVADGFNFRVRKISNPTAPGATIVTFAGNGQSGTQGDGGPATQAQLATLESLLVVAGNLYIGQGTNVRVVSGSSPFNISTYAGTNNAGFAGDGSSNLTGARFDTIGALAYDGSNLYLADSRNFRVRRITSGGALSTFAGNGTVDFTADGSFATNSDIYNPNNAFVDRNGTPYFLDGGGYAIRSFGGNLLSTLVGNGFPGITADGGASASSVTPTSFATDGSGTVYFTEGNRVRKAAGGVLSTIANGSGAAGFSGDNGQASAAAFNSPAGLALFSQTLYVSDTANNRVRAINLQTGVVNTVAGNGIASFTGDGGPATTAGLNTPRALAVDLGGASLYIVDSGNSHVRVVNLQNGIISSVSGALNGPNGVAVDQNGSVFISLGGASTVVEVAGGTVTTVAGTGVPGYSGDGGPATSAKIQPTSIAFDTSANLYITDASGRVRKTRVFACFYGYTAPGNQPANGVSTTISVSVTYPYPYCPIPVSSTVPWITVYTNAGGGSVSYTVAKNTSTAPRTGSFTIAGQTYTITQAGAINYTAIGVLENSYSALDANGNGSWDGPPGDSFYSFLPAQPGDIAVVGDWNGDGRSKVGIYRNGFFILDYNGNGQYDSGVDKFIAWGGGAGYIPIVGDWNGSGTTKVGYYHAGMYLLDYNGDGAFNAGDLYFSFTLGAGETPVVGDWNGDHRTKVGVYLNSQWLLDYNGNGVFDSGDKSYTYSVGGAGRPVVGDWSASGRAKIGLYRNDGFFILDYDGDGVYTAGVDRFIGWSSGSGDTPVIGDWNGDGRAKVGYYNHGFWLLDMNGNGVFDGYSIDKFIALGGFAGEQPLVGKW